MTTIFVVCDAPLYSSGLVHTLGLDGRLDIVGSASDLEEGSTRVRDLSDRPHAVLADIEPPNVSDAASTLSATFPELPVIALIGSRGEDAIIRWAEMGASGLVSRHATLDELVRIVERVIMGDAACTPEVTATLLRRVAWVAKGATPQASEAGLTSREQQVVLLLEEGLSNKEIARRLEIGVATVKNHVHHILAKLHANRRGEAVAMLQEDRSGQSRFTAGLRRGGAAAS
jgi:DNA-binding NarL/FixJ family response regulator